MDARAYPRGRNAYLAGKPTSKNPYHHGTSFQSANYREWLCGWREACKADPLLDDDERADLLLQSR
jgi:ribosome modulation factor